MPKPIDFRHLKELVGIADSIKPIVELAVTDILSPHVQNLMNKIGFEQTTCRELIVTFVDQLVKSIKDIDELRITKDFVEISKILHQLKGASGTVRLNEINKIICEAEELIDKKEFTRGLDTIDLLKKNSILAYNK